LSRWNQVVRPRQGRHVLILPDAAEHWTVTNGGRTYTFYLRPNVGFGNGAPVAAADVAFSVNRTLSPAFAQQSGAFLLDDIVGAKEVSDGRAIEASGIQVLDAHTLRIRLLAPTITFLDKLATPAGYIVSPTAVNADPRRWDHHAFGSGPFKVARWVPNPYYWGGKLRITGIDMPFIPEPLAAYKLYRAGGVDTMGNIRWVLGVPVNVQQYTHSAYLTLLDKRAYQIAVIDWTADYPDPENFLTQQFRTGSPNNRAWSNRAFDSLVDRAASMPARNPTRLALYGRAEELAMDEAAAIPLVNPTAGILLREGVHELQVIGGQLLANDWTRVTVTRR